MEIGPPGPEIARHLKSVLAAVPLPVDTIFARADSGFYCGEAVVAYQSRGVQFIISARKTARLVEQLKAAEWKPSRAHGRGWPMRVPLPAGRLGESLSVPRPALPKEVQTEKGGRAGAVPMVRHAPVYLSGLRHGQEGRH